MNYPKECNLVEVGPRDGLQSEPEPTSVDFRVELIDRLAQCGLRTIETGSFVSPKWVPKMAGTDQVMAQINRSESVSYVALVPNVTGLNAALAAEVSQIAVFVAASESFSQKNINCSIDDSFRRLMPVSIEASKRHIPVRGYVSCVAGCPYEGDVKIRQVVSAAERLLELGCHEISLGDTIGVGTPGKIVRMLRSASQSVPVNALAVHFHDTYGQALSNILASLDFGIRTIDSSIAGLGGCPYANGATGNVATENVVYMLDGLGVSTGVNLDRLVQVTDFVSRYLKRPPASGVSRAMLAKRTLG